MRFSQLVVAALSAPLCVDGNRKDEVVEDTGVASFGGMPSDDEENHLSMTSMLTKPLRAMSSAWVDERGLAAIDINPCDWITPSTQETELQNPGSEIDHASREENESDDDFAVDIGVLSTERKLSTECTSYPVLNQTGHLTSQDFSNLIYYCYGGSPYPEDCPDEYSVGLHCWNTSMITDLFRAFYRLTAFNDDISSWNTGKVTNMDSTFFRASSFNSDISSWDTGNVTALFGTFDDASSFNSDISSWDTGKVTTMEGTFYAASSFNVDISSWDIRNVMFAKYMFFGAVEFNQCLGSWAAKTPSTVDTNTMLYGTACPNQSDPDPNKGPWCQGFVERCFGACSDAEEFRFGRNDRKSCDSIKDITAPTEKKLKKKIRRFCNRKAFRHEEATGKTIRRKHVCQESCGSRGFGPGKRCVNNSL